MANKKTTKKATAKPAKKPAAKKTKAVPEKIEEKDFLTSEIAIIVSFLIAVLLFLSNFRVNGNSIIGAFGNLLRQIQLGLFGWMGYVFPVLVFLVTVFILANRDNPKVPIKIIALFLAVISLAGLFQAFFAETEGDISIIKEAFRLDADGKPHAGGFLGAAFAMALVSVIGKTGAILVMLAIFIISLVAITEKSFVNAVKRGSDKAYTSVKDDVLIRREEARFRRDQEMISRAKRKVEGVDFAATNLSASTPQDVHDAEAIATRVASIDLKEKDDYATVTDTFAKADPNVFKGNINIPGSVEDTVPFDEDMQPATGTPTVSARPSAAGMSSANARPSDAGMPDVNTRPAAASNVPVRSSAETAVSTTDGAGSLSEEDEIKKRIIANKSVKTSTAKTKEADQSADEAVRREINAKNAKPPKPYRIPPMNLLERGTKAKHSEKEYKDTAVKLQQTLNMFGVNVTVTDISVGPTVTRYELHPEQGVKVSSVLNLQDDLKLALAAADVRIEAPIPGKAAIGIEVPNKENNTVMLRDIIDTPEFKNSKAKVPFAVGKDIAGDVVVSDIARMPHVLIAGATGSGKSVCINGIILSILYKYSPEDVKMIMVDPKVVELSVYNGIPHLMIPVVNDPKKASGALNWAVQEMMTRYRMFEEAGTRDIAGYNTKHPDEKMPYIVIIIDELADLMMVAKSEVEDAICRIAQLARAAGIHLVIATQRPSVDVITGLIKANIPSRIAFAVSSGVDSKTIIDGVGAEKLLGKGDMLYKPQDVNKPIRIQGAYVSEREINDVVDYIKAEGLESNYDEETISKIAAASSGAQEPGMAGDRDELFIQAGKYIIDKDKASIGNLQRAFKIGFNRAARIMDQLADAGVVGPEQGTKPREVLMSAEQFENMLEQEG